MWRHSHLHIRKWAGSLINLQTASNLPHRWGWGTVAPGQFKFNIEFTASITGAWLEVELLKSGSKIGSGFKTLTKNRGSFIGFTDQNRESKFRFQNLVSSTLMEGSIFSFAVRSNHKISPCDFIYFSYSRRIFQKQICSLVVFSLNWNFKTNKIFNFLNIF